MKSIRHFITIVESSLLLETEDNSQQARLKRATEQGFDVNDPHYHGTPGGEFDEFENDRTADENLAYGKGVYATRDPSAASGYSKPGTSWGNDTEEARSTVYKVFMNVKNPFDLDKSYPYAEVKRILEHCYNENDLKQIEFWKELQEEAEFTDGRYEETIELEDELSNLEYADRLEGVDPDDYDDGVNDADYISDLNYALELEKKDIERKLSRIENDSKTAFSNHNKMLASGRIGSALGRTIYKALWTNTSEYFDWKREAQLFGGETDTFDFKTWANQWLEELGYDGLRHVDHYNPGNKGKAHVVTIAFHPHQVRSVNANFASDKVGSPKLHETKRNRDGYKR